jgi:hypothetical protein
MKIGSHIFQLVVERSVERCEDDCSIKIVELTVEDESACVAIYAALESGSEGMSECVITGRSHYDCGAQKLAQAIDMCDQLQRGLNAVRSKIN